MDQHEWGLLRETVVRRTQASGASREDAEDATHDALLAAIGQPQHPQSQVAWVSTVAQRRRVDLIRYRAREQRIPAARTGGSDPTAAGPEDVVVERAHASWLAASLTQLPPTTREVVDAVGSGMAPAEVARSMNLSARSVESHLTRARRHLRRMAALTLPLGAMLGWTLRTRPGSRMVPAALCVAAPVVATVVALLPSSSPLDAHTGAAPGPGAGRPPVEQLVPTPRGAIPGPAVVGPVAARSADGPADGSGEPAAQPSGSSVAGRSVSPDRTGQSGAGQLGGAQSDASRTPENRSVPPASCPLELPVVGDLGCVLGDLVHVLVDRVSPPVPALPVG